MLSTYCEKATCTKNFQQLNYHFHGNHKKHFKRKVELENQCTVLKRRRSLEGRMKKGEGERPFLLQNTIKGKARVAQEKVVHIRAKIFAAVKNIGQAKIGSASQEKEDNM